MMSAAGWRNIPKNNHRLACVIRFALMLLRRSFTNEQTRCGLLWRTSSRISFRRRWCCYLSSAFVLRRCALPCGFRLSGCRGLWRCGLSSCPFPGGWLGRFGLCRLRYCGFHRLFQGRCRGLRSSNAQLLPGRLYCRGLRFCGHSRRFRLWLRRHDFGLFAGFGSGRLAAAALGLCFRRTYRRDFDNWCWLYHG